MRGIIDRIEDGIAVIETDEENFLSAPAAICPQNAAEGSVVDYTADEDGNILSLTVNEAATAIRRERIAALKKRTFTR